MPVIAFANPKGGAGKTTSALLLASELAARGARVAIIDADPERWISQWGALPGKPATITILGNITEDTIVDQIEAAATVGAAFVELHTGAFADAPTPDSRKTECNRLLAAIPLARQAGLGVNLGHGLDYDNIFAFKYTSGISEYSIGHSIIARAVMTGLVEAVAAMCAIINRFPD